MDDHKELIYFLYLRDFTTKQLAALRNQSDRNIRGVRSTILGQIEKRVLMILVDRQGEDFPFTMDEPDFLTRHEEEIPDTIKKLDKEKLALLKEIGDVAPTYRIELRERPTSVWDFNSLLLCVQMMFSFMLTDENSSMKGCKHCGKAFVATRPNVEFCSPQCKNQYNVYKNRAKKNDTPI